MDHNQVKTKPEHSLHSVLSLWHAVKVTQTKPVQFCMDSWGIWIWHVGSHRWQEYQDVHVLPLGAQPLKKGKLFIWSRLQITRTAPLRHLKAFTFQPPLRLRYLCWKAADQILGNSDFPISRVEGSCPCPAVWCDRAAVTASVSLPPAATFVLHGQHALWVPALFSYKCIQLSLENNKRFPHFCKQLVPVSALGGKNTIPIADWISLDLHSRKGFYFFVVSFW